MDDAVGPLHDKTVRITGISYQSGQAVLTARSADPASTGARRRNTYYFVQEHGTWKLNSIGKRMDADVPPPPAPPGR